eukprot:14013593-Alexandrium_andersonii.AAC.1
MGRAEQRAQAPSLMRVFCFVFKDPLCAPTLAQVITWAKGCRGAYSDCNRNGKGKSKSKGWSSKIKSGRG